MVENFEKVRNGHVVDDLRVGGRPSFLSWLPAPIYRAVTRPFSYGLGPSKTGAAVAPIDIRAVEDAQRASKLKSLLNFALKVCLDSRHEHWGLHAFAFRTDESDAEHAEKLRAFATAQVLRWSGDVGAFLTIDDALRTELGFEGSNDDRFHRDLSGYLMDEFARVSTIVPSDGDGRHLVLSLVILDERQLQRFIKLCLASLLAPGNIEGLRSRRRPLLLISAREQQRKTLERMSLPDLLRCEVRYRDVPEHLVNGAMGERRDTLGSALQTVHLLEAGKMSADVCLLEPHRIYSEGYFARLLNIANRGVTAVMTASLRTREQAMQRELDLRHRVGNALTVPPAELVDFALDRLHELDGELLRSANDDPTRLPRRRSFAWCTDSKLQIHSADPSVSYVGREVTMRLPTRLYMAPLRALAAVQPLDPPSYLATSIDALVHVDVVPEWLTDPGHVPIGFGEFKAFFWDNLDDWQGELFFRPCCLPMGGSAAKARHRISQPAVDAAVRSLADLIGPFHPWRGPEQLGTILHVLQGYETSVYGRGDMPRIVEEAKRAFARMVTEKSSIPADLRKDLIRFALNFDQFGYAAELANSGAADTAFQAEFIHYARRQLERNNIHANSIRAAAGGVRISVIGSIVWGPTYISKYLDYHLASLLASGNIPELAKRGLVVLSIITTKRGREQIEAHPTFPLLSQYAKVQFTLFSEGYLKAREEARYNFYYFYGMLDHLNVYLARQLGADLYLLPVDCVYSGEALSNLARHLDGGADCCSVSGVETEEEAFLSALEANRKGVPVLDIGGKELLTMAVAHAGRYYRSLIMSPENGAFSRHPRELVWPVDGGFVTHSVFMHPLAVSLRMLARPFWPNHENVDYGLLPRLLQDDGKMHIVADASEVAIAHFSPPQVRDDYVHHGFSLRRFVGAHDHDYAMHRDFFDAPQSFPCAHPDYPPSDTYERELAAIGAALLQPRYEPRSVAVSRFDLR